MDEQLLVNKLRDYLPQKRYVVVFDDVWKIEFWDSIKNSLPDNHIGGRIIITTHNSHCFQNRTGPGGRTVKTGNRDENRFFKPKEPDFLLIP